MSTNVSNEKTVIYHPPEVQHGLFTSVRLVNGIPHSIMESLGCRRADFLQCNSVVWIEGPSDIIFLETWLNIYAAENNLAIFKRGKHYEFQTYGGTLLDSLCLIRDGRFGLGAAYRLAIKRCLGLC